VKEVKFSELQGRNIASIVFCFVLQRTLTNENNGGTEWQGIQQLLPQDFKLRGMLM